MSTERLELLKLALHPAEPMDIIEQCEIVAEALSFTGAYIENNEGLALYLEISESKVYQMNYIHHNMIDPLKNWFRGTVYQCHTTYDKAKLTPEAQLEFIKSMNILLTGNDSSDTTKINKEEN